MTDTPTGTVNADATQILGDGRAIIEMTNVDKLFGSFQALKNINLDIPERKVTAFIGPSGCGKSTLLYLLGLLDQWRGAGSTEERPGAHVVRHDVPELVDDDHQAQGEDARQDRDRKIAVQEVPLRVIVERMSRVVRRASWSAASAVARSSRWCPSRRAAPFGQPGRKAQDPVRSLISELTPLVLTDSMPFWQPESDSYIWLCPITWWFFAFSTK